MPRALQVQRAHGRERLNLSLVVVVDGSAAFCTLTWGRALIYSRNRISWEVRRARLSSGPGPVEPLGDAAYIGQILKGILDERVVLVRSVVYGEAGMGGPLRRVAGDELFDLETETFVFGNSERVERSSEAIMYSWSGRRDDYVVPPRYD